jgi:hypothetical protein
VTRLPRTGALAACAALVALAASAPAGAALQFFSTPSKNIGCIWDSSQGGYLRCDIGSGLRNPAPTKPRGCELDWGSSVSLTRRGKTTITCAGDTVIGQPGRVLRYGQTWRRGGFTCTSRSAGLTCRNAAGHGFFLSRQSWRRF